MIEMYDINDKRINSIKTSPDEALEAYLRANAKKEHISDPEQEIISQVKEKLTSRRTKEQTQQSKKFPSDTIQSSLLDIFVCSIKLKELKVVKGLNSNSDISSGTVLIDNKRCQ